jgi:mono/diheme cytochrome c family protein
MKPGLASPLLLFGTVVSGSALAHARPPHFIPSSLETAPTSATLLAVVILLLALIVLALWRWHSQPKASSFMLGSLALLLLAGASNILWPRNIMLANQALAGANAPTFYQDLAPLFAQNCATCHQTGGIGPFNILDAATAKARASDILDYSAAALMPPWKAGGQSPKMQDERKLNDSQKQLIANWVAAGAPLGDEKSAVAVSVPKSSFPNASVSLKMPLPYLPDSQRSDDYRCFIIDPKLERDVFISAFQVVPGQRSLVHHVILNVIDPSEVAEAQALDQRAEGPGWTCFGGPGVARAAGLGGWVPGISGTVLPNETGYQLQKGQQIVMQVHYNTRAGVRADQTTLNLVYSPRQLRPIVRQALAAPVELRCTGAASNDINNPCSRLYALKHAGESIGEANKRAVARAAGLLALCDKRLSDLAGNDAKNQSMSCQRQVPRNALALGVHAHMHQLGKSAKIVLNPGKSSEKVLLDIPAWDFHWQNEYWFESPIILKRGDTIAITCNYDNSSENQAEGATARYIIWGEGTRDEMCLGAVIGTAQ